MTYTEQLKQLLNSLKTLMYNWTRYKVTYITGGINNTSLFITKNGILGQKIYVNGDIEYQGIDNWILYDESDRSEVTTITTETFYNLNNLAPGTYRAIAYCGGYETEAQQIRILSLEETCATSIKDIHDYLVEYIGTPRTTTGNTFGYYLSGIAKAIRYITEETELDSDTAESFSSLIAKLAEFLNECSHEQVEPLFEDLGENGHSVTAHCMLCNSNLQTELMAHSYDENGNCICGAFKCPHTNQFLQELFVDSDQHKVESICNDCGKTTEEYEPHSGDSCTCGAIKCQGCGTYYSDADGVEACSNTEDCANYHTHEYTLQGCEPIEDAQHREYWECRFDGAYYNITESCVLNQECKCGRTLYTCTCEDPGCSCTFVVGEEAEICDNCIRNCTQPGPQEPEATTCQFCGGNHYAAEIIDCERSMYCDQCGNYYYNREGYCPDCPVPGSPSCAECGATYNTQEEADQCNLTTTCPGNRKPEVTFCTWCNSTDHSAADIYDCPNAVDCPSHGYYVGSKCPMCSDPGEGGETTSCMCDCGCSNSAGYDGYCDSCRTNDCDGQEPEATTCRHCGSNDHDYEWIGDCPNAIYCTVDTHDTYYIGSCPIHGSGESGGGGNTNICSCNCGCTNEATHGSYCFSCYDICQRGPEAT